MNKQVLIINVTRMGDLVQTIPLLGRLQHEWPGVEIDVMVDITFAPMAALLPGIRHVAGDVGQAHAVAPVPLVRVHPGVEFSGKELRKAFPQVRDPFRREHVFDDQEPGAAKAGEIRVLKRVEAIEGKSCHRAIPSG